jgi:Uma2 family endonuclease
MTETSDLLLQMPMTAEAYLKHQRSGSRESAPKYEFINKKLILLTGASRSHATINSNLAYILQHQMRTHKSPHFIWGNDMRVVSYVEERNYFYPDVVIAEKPYFENDEYQDTLMNPTVVMEVLSKSTEGIDRGAKLRSFRKTKSVREYVLVNQYEVCIEHFYADDAGNWHFGDIVTEGDLTLKTLPFVLNIEEVYFKVDFDDPAASKDPDPTTEM